jgi:hypothetical protein
MPWQFPLLSLCEQRIAHTHTPDVTIPWHALELDDEATLVAHSQAGAFDTFLPEWVPMRQGERQYQHRHHDFTLELHTLKVIIRTRRSPYFQALSPEQHRFVTLAALLHDVAKLGYSKEERPTAPPDAAHPAKGSIIVKQRLPWWGYTPQQTQDMARLVEHHQLFGRLLMKHNHHQSEPSEAELQHLALILQSETMLNLLLPLTEGDIRSVKADDAIFTPALEAQLQRYSDQVRGYLRQIDAVRSSHSHSVPPLQHWWIHSDYAHLEAMACPCGLNTLPDTLLLPIHSTSGATTLPQGWTSGIRITLYSDHLWHAHWQLDSTLWEGFQSDGLQSYEQQSDEQPTPLFYNLYLHQRHALRWGNVGFDPSPQLHSIHTASENLCLGESPWWHSNPIATAVVAQADSPQFSRLTTLAHGLNLPFYTI